MSARVLMVDDEPDAELLFRQNFRREIRSGTYTFEFALSAEEAIEKLRNDVRADAVLVLSDVNMPGMSGIDLLRKIREQWPRTKVFMITAYGDAGTEQAVRQLGADRFITKPVDFDSLKVELSDALETPG